MTDKANNIFMIVCWGIYFIVTLIVMIRSKDKKFKREAFYAFLISFLFFPAILFGFFMIVLAAMMAVSKFFQWLAKLLF
jgi:hypothetical protein